MSANPNWARWILASASKHFMQLAAANNLHIFIEGTNRQTDNVPTHFELRIDGPQATELSKGYWQLDAEINLLYKVSLSDDTHASAKVAGILQSGMTDLCIYRYGDGPADDDTFLGTLSLRQDARNPVRLNNFGQIAPELRISQGTVEGSYRMHLTT